MTATPTDRNALEPDGRADGRRAAEADASAASLEGASGGRLLRTGEVAALFGVSERSVRHWADEGRLPCVKTPGRHRLFREDEVRRALEALTFEAQNAADGSQPERAGDDDA